MANLTRRGFVAGSALAAFEGARLIAGCESTTGRRVTLESRARGSVGRGEAFTTALGFAIALERAEMWVGSILYLEGAALARRFGAVSVAHAHPGHYEEGMVLGEMIEAQVVDLLAGETILGVGGGVSGALRSARVSFEHDATPDPLEGQLVVVAGEASRDGQAIPFSAALDATHLAASDTGRPVVSGCPVAGGDVRTDGVVRLEVSLPMWLDQVDFGSITVDGGSMEEVVALTPGEAPHNALRRGVQKAASFSFTFEPVSA